jgi:hypothetical protein
MKLKQKLQKIQLRMEARNLGLDGTSMDASCIAGSIERIATFGMPLD